MPAVTQSTDKRETLDKSKVSRTGEPTKESKTMETSRSKRTPGLQQTLHSVVTPALSSALQSPWTPQSPRIRESPKSLQSSRTPQSQRTLELPRTWQSSRASQVSGIPQSPRVPESSISPQLPGTRKASRIIESPWVLESTMTAQSPGTPHLPNTLQSPILQIPEPSKTLQASRTPASLQIPQLPGTKQAPTTPQQEPHLHLRSQEMVDCFLRSKVSMNFLMQYTALTRHYKELFTTSNGSLSLEIQVYNSQPVNMSRNASFPCGVITLRSSTYFLYCCALRLRVPKGMYVAVRILELVSQLEITVMDERLKRSVSDMFNVTENNGEGVRVFVSSFDVVSVVIALEMCSGSTCHEEHQEEHHKEYRLRLEFQAVSYPGPRLQMRYTSVNKGFVQTFSYQYKVCLMNPHHDNWVEIKIPLGHVTLISFPALETMEQCVILLAGDRGNETLIRVCPDNLDRPPATIWNSSLIVVYVVSHVERIRGYGFRLHFSFHNVSAALIPTKLPDYSWNCSVPFVSDFLYHLSCNLEVECHNAEDEINCSYSSDLCGPCYLTLGEGCFFYVRREERKITWGEASSVCTLRGGRLATLNTVSKWLDAVSLLPTRPLGGSLYFVGIRNTPSTLPLWYTDMYQWTDDTIGLYLNPYIIRSEKIPARCVRKCGFMKLSAPRQNPKSGSLWLHSGCQTKQGANILCEKPLPLVSTHDIALTNNNRTNSWLPSQVNSMYIDCPLGHYTHRFLACDAKSSCWRRHHSSRCKAPLTSLPPSFECVEGRERLSYTLLCDRREDCSDGSDEDFCSFPACTSGQFSCDNGQCILTYKACDGWGDCEKNEDENQCTSVIKYPASIPPPAFVSLSPDGRLGLFHSTETVEGTCPHTHFRCLKEGHCLPVFLRCNDVYDCPGREDERACDTCPGFYRCRGSTVCLPHGDLCDGHAHCPQHDDELACELTCPPLCVCVGLTFFCSRSFTASAHPLLRYLDASGSGMTPAFLKGNALLIHLIIAHSNLTLLDGLVLPNLLVLDVHDSQVRAVSRADLAGAPQLRELSLAGNPLTFLFEDVGGSDSSLFMHELDLSRVALHALNVTAFSAFPSLNVLNLSHSGVERVLGDTFGVIEQLREIDLRGCPLTWFPRGLFQGSDNLRTVYAHSFKVCCPAVLPPDFNLHNCFAPSDDISSCDDLLGSRAYTVCAVLLSAIALFGNAVSFVFRKYVSKRESKLGYGNFVTHLSVSDFVMGVYLAVIGVADQVYKGAYLWNDVYWRHSAACKLAGFLSLLSSEVSALIMCLITLDRFLVLQFPFSRLHFSPGSAHVASIIVWICGVLLVSVPVLPVTSHWEFYSHTGICIPLPVGRTNFAGHGYSFAILVVFNFVLFVFISIGQLSIYWSVRANAMSVSNTTKKTKDLTIARRLITVAMSDFLCWFPVGVLGLMAARGFAFPGEVNVAVAIFVLPLNSAVNPCLYTLNVILERRTRVREEKLRALLLAQIKGRN